MKILAINPGSTSTKLGIYCDGKIISEYSVEHSAEELSDYEKCIEQKPLRSRVLSDFIRENGYTPSSFDAIVGRGAPIKPVASGVYPVNEKMIHDLYNECKADHPSILGGLLAHEIANEAGIPAYIVDPVSVDEFEDIARISGIPEISRDSLSHALNIKAVARRFSKDSGKSYEDMDLIICHLGGGISITAHRKGRMIDVNNANDDGPLSPERSGGLPIGQLVRLCFDRKWKDAGKAKNYLTKKGGLIAYLGTNSVRDIMAEGDKEKTLFIDAMIYQIAKEIGKMAVVLNGSVDYILITGGIAHNKAIMDKISEYTSFIADMKVYPGEGELLALCEGVEKVLSGDMKASIYE